MKLTQASSILRRAGWDIVRRHEGHQVASVAGFGTRVRQEGNWIHVATKPGSSWAIEFASMPESEVGAGRDVDSFELLPAADVATQGRAAGQFFRSLRGCLRVIDAVGNL